MDNKKGIEIIDSMISAIPKENKHIASFICSPDIYYSLGLKEHKNKDVIYKEYRGYVIYTSYIIPQKEFACSGSLYF